MHTSKICELPTRNGSTIDYFSICKTSCILFFITRPGKIKMDWPPEADLHPVFPEIRSKHFIVTVDGWIVGPEGAGGVLVFSSRCAVRRLAAVKLVILIDFGEPKEIV